MKSKTPTTHNKGFTALVAVILLASGTLALSFVALSVADDYSDSVYLHERRIQDDLNKNACSDVLKLEKVKDTFVKGTITISEFDCTATI